MGILLKLAIMGGWFFMVVAEGVAVWLGIIWLINRNLIGRNGAAAILLVVLFITLWLCTKYN